MLQVQWLNSRKAIKLISNQLEINLKQRRSVLSRLWRVGVGLIHVRFGHVLLSGSEQLNLVLIRTTHRSRSSGGQEPNQSHGNLSRVSSARENRLVTARSWGKPTPSFPQPQTQLHLFVSQINEDLSVACYFIWCACRSSFGKFLEGSRGSANCYQKSELRNVWNRSKTTQTGKSVSQQLEYLLIDLIDRSRVTDYTAKKVSIKSK